MAQLLSESAALGIKSDFAGKLLAEFGAQGQKTGDKPILSPAPSLSEPLSQRELEILHLIAQGLSNREISQQLFLALNTIKGHNQKIYSKLYVQSRTEAIARARELGLL
jgi:LuxR family transcriptional regulator, maltose regulon positive regulatory protein